jgi:hypothetical protein
MPFIIYNILIIESNPQISVYEQGEWTDKGRYTAAVSFNEDIEWIKQKTDYILPVCYVRHYYNLQNYLILISLQEQQPAFVPALSVTTPLGSTGTTPATDTHDSMPLSATTSHFPMASSHTGSPFKDKMIASLNIPVDLTDHKDVNLGYAWQKYNACLAAIKTCNLFWESKKLRDVFD